MACNLKLSSTADADFVGNVGSNATLLLTSADDPVADIVTVRYAGQDVGGPPFQFSIQAGMKLLVVLVEATVPGALLELREDCGDGSSNLLDSFHYDPGNPANGYVVKGI
jgi:hypothetical protein